MQVLLCLKSIYMTALETIEVTKQSSTSIRINQFPAVNNPKITGSTTIDKILVAIKHGDKNLPCIQKARAFGKGTEEYDKIKAYYLPSVRFNFLFDGYAKNENIIAPTGLIYLDADNIETIPNNEYIFAKWKSLSGEGYGILVRVEGLTLDNHSETYNELANIIGITADIGGRKATQQTVLSYDPDLYHNEDSKVYVCKKVSFDNNIKERRGLGGNDTFLETGVIRLNNIDEYFDDDTPYKVFTPKVHICNPFIPRDIPEGQRNYIMYFLLSQYALLNKSKQWKFLSWRAEIINAKMSPPLKKGEINNIIHNVLSQRDKGELRMIYNQERRVLFNPTYSFSINKKMQIVNMVLGGERSQKSKELIYQALEGWDFETKGKVTQKKITEITGLSIATVKRYWAGFQD